MHKAEEEYWELKKETERLRAEHEVLRAEYERLKIENEKSRVEYERSRAENEIGMEKSKVDLEEIKKILREASILSKENQKGLKELKVQVDKTTSTVNSLGFNVGASAEELFINSIEKIMKVDGIKYYEMAKNYVVCAENGRQLAEIDALLFNKNYICIIEIKHRATEEDIQKLLEKTVPTFKTEETKYQKYELLPVIAAMSFDKKALSKAKDLKITLLRYRGEYFEVIHPK